MENKDKRYVAQLLENRRSARKFQEDYKISDHDLDLIVEAARFSPSSFGILNSRLIVVEDKEFRNKLIPYFYYQNSFANSSVYLLFIVDKGDYILSESIFKAKEYIKDEETLVKYQIDLSNIMSSWDDKFNKKTGNNTTDWSVAQTYIQMTSAMIQAEQLGIDSTPHEGFNRPKLDQYLIDNGYMNDKETLAIGLALGKVDKTKSHANNKVKVRKTKEDFVTYIKK